MKRLIIVACLISANLFYKSSFAEIYTCKVSSIIDGDSVYLRCQDNKLQNKKTKYNKKTKNKKSNVVKVRLAGIDAPEKKQALWGKRATNALKNKAPKNTTVILNKIDYDKYGRIVGFLYNKDCLNKYYGNLNSSCDVNLSMIKSGMAVAYRSINTPSSYFQEEHIAKRNKIGIWSQKGLQQNPKKYRKIHPIN